MDVTGKAAVVTGPTSGIGKEIARGLVERGMRVILAARDEAKAEALRQELDGAVEFVHLDLVSLASVRKAASEIRRGHPALHLLVNNAGVHTSQHLLTEDGFETTFQVNHLGHFLLTNELLPTLKTGAPSRIVNVASEAHRGSGALDLPFLLGRKRWSGIKAYTQSKLCNILHARELARQLAGSAVSAFAAHPGTVRTGWARGEESGLFRAAVWAATPFMISPEKGARTPLDACLRDDVPSGSYLARRRITRPSGAARDDEAARALWEASERLVAGQTVVAQ